MIDHSDPHPFATLLAATLAFVALTTITFNGLSWAWTAYRRRRLRTLENERRRWSRLARAVVRAYPFPPEPLDPRD